MKTVHLAAHAIQIGNRVVQRCMLCGHKILELNTEHIYGPDTPGLPVFKVGSLVSISEGSSTQVYATLVKETVEPYFEDPWEDSCLGLVE